MRLNKVAVYPSTLGEKEAINIERILRYLLNHIKDFDLKDSYLNLQYSFLPDFFKSMKYLCYPKKQYQFPQDVKGRIAIFIL